MTTLNTYQFATTYYKTYIALTHTFFFLPLDQSGLETDSLLTTLHQLPPKGPVQDPYLKTTCSLLNISPTFEAIHTFLNTPNRDELSTPFVDANLYA